MKPFEKSGVEKAGPAAPTKSAKRNAAWTERWLGARALHGLVYALGSAVLVYPLALPVVAALAGVGAFLGALLGPTIAQRNFRTPVLAAFALLGVALAWQLKGAISALLAAVGPEDALLWGDGTFFFFAALFAATGLRALTSRRRAFALVEVGWIAFAFGQLVVAHRQGAINRPFEIADAIIAAGGDPTTVFFFVGACAIAAVVLLLLRDSVPRLLLHVSALAVLLLLFLQVSSALEVPPPPPGGAGLGLRPDESEGEPDEQDESEGEGQGGGSSNDNDLEFRDNIESDNDQVPVAVVLFHDDYSPPTGTYYFRQGAFSQFNGDRLVAASAVGFDTDVARDFPLRAFDIEGAPALNQNRMPVQTTVALLAEHTRPFGLEAPVTLQPATNPDPSRFRRTYSVTSAVMAADFVSMIGATMGSTWSDDHRAHYLEGPDDPRYAELASRILDESLPFDLRNDPVAKVAAITSWLGREGTYSLRSNHASADDPTADFLFGDITGYCVHFAHAGAYLLRAAGVPARVATGYAIAEQNRRGGSALLVSGDTSHAWPEVFIDGFGWVVTDISPQTVISSPPPPPDPDLQRLLGELARGLRPVPPEPDGPLPAAVARGIDLLKLGGSALLVLLLAAFAFCVLFKLWRAMAPRFVSDSAQPRVAYRAALDRLGESGLRRRPGESREAFAARVERAHPALGAPLSELTIANVGAAFGSKRGLSAERARTLLRDLRAGLGRELPRWRRVLGALNPWSWIFSR